MTRVAEILQELVRIPSVNPEGSPDFPQSGEEKIALRVQEMMAAFGAQTELEYVLPGRPNVYGTFPTNGAGKPKVLLAPHLDTVGVEGMTIDPFCGEIREGKLWGRGASDTKGTLAAMLAALEELGPEKVAALGAEITIVGLMAEETGQHGSRHLAKHRPYYDFALVGEPTDCQSVHCHKGCSWVIIETRGIACHGSTPERGKSAIAAMAPVITALETDFRRLLSDQRWAHPVLGLPTINVGIIKGGSRTNIVPDYCEAHLDIRETPALTAAGTQQVLTSWLTDSGFNEVIIQHVASAPPLDTPADNPYVKKLSAIGSTLVGAPWLCDAAWLAQAGIPGVAAGPGSIAQAHTKDEFIDLEALNEGVRFYRRFLESL